MPNDTLPVMGRPKKDEPSESLRLPQSVVRKLRRLALHANMDPGDYVKQEFGAMIDKKHAKMLDEQLRAEDKQG